LSQLIFFYGTLMAPFNRPAKPDERFYLRRLTPLTLDDGRIHV